MKIGHERQQMAVGRIRSTIVSLLLLGSSCCVAQTRQMRPMADRRQLLAKTMKDLKLDPKSVTTDPRLLGVDHDRLIKTTKNLQSGALTAADVGTYLGDGTLSVAVDIMGKIMDTSQDDKPDSRRRMETNKHRRLVRNVMDLQSGLTPEDLVDKLVGSGNPKSPTVSNITFTGDNASAGIFSGGFDGSIGIEEGVVLSSGCAAKAVGPNLVDNQTCAHFREGDDDLDMLITRLANPDFDLYVFVAILALFMLIAYPGDLLDVLGLTLDEFLNVILYLVFANIDFLDTLFTLITGFTIYDVFSALGFVVPNLATFDAAVLEFDMVCGEEDEVTFEYVFGSEEYNEFALNQDETIFDDVFGFFLDGTNIALVPGAEGELVHRSGYCQPVSIDNINNFTNAELYNDNDPSDNGIPTPYHVEADGFTEVLRATRVLKQGVKYHLKFAIADTGPADTRDYFYDSWVFLKSQSLICERETFPDEFSEQYEIEFGDLNSSIVCGNLAEVEQNLTSALQEYFDDQLTICSSGKNVTTVNLLDWEPKLECDEQRRLEEANHPHAERNLKRKNRRTRGRVKKKGRCNGCKRKNRRLMELDTMELDTSDQTIPPPSLPNILTKYGFNAVNVTELLRPIECEDKTNPNFYQDCKSTDPEIGGACCGEDGCACINPSAGLCDDIGCCVPDSSNFDPTFCTGLGSCGQYPCLDYDIVPCPKNFDNCDPATDNNCCLPGNKGNKPKYTLRAGEKIEEGQWMCRPDPPHYAFGLLAGERTAHLLQPVDETGEMCHVLWTAEKDGAAASGDKLELDHDGRLVLRDQQHVERWYAGCGGGYKPKLKMSKVRDEKGDSAKVVHLFMREKKSERKLGKKNKKKNKKNKKAKKTKKTKKVTWWLNKAGDEFDNCYGH